MRALTQIIEKNLDGPGIFRVDNRLVKYNARHNYLFFEDNWTTIDTEKCKILERTYFTIRFTFDGKEHIFEIVEPIKIKY